MIWDLEDKNILARGKAKGEGARLRKWRQHCCNWKNRVVRKQTRCIFSLVSLGRTGCKLAGSGRYSVYILLYRHVLACWRIHLGNKHVYREQPTSKDKAKPFASYVDSWLHSDHTTSLGSAQWFLNVLPSGLEVFPGLEMHEWLQLIFPVALSLHLPLMPIYHWIAPAT